MVIDFDRQIGRIIIPIGFYYQNFQILRGLNSTGDGLILSSQEVQGDAKVAQNFKEVTGMPASNKILGEWTRLEMVNRLKEMGTTEDVLLSEYRFFSINYERSESFRRLVDFFRSV